MYCSYDDVDHKIQTFLIKERPADYDYIFITDISVNQETAEALDAIHHTQASKVVLLDHHETALWLNQHEWANVSLKHGNKEDFLSTSGTSLVFQWLHVHYPEMIAQSRADFTEMVRRYDTWDWASIYNDPEPKRLNDLFWIYGQERFVDYVLYQFKYNDNGDFAFDENDNFTLELEQERINRRINKAMKQLTIKNVGRYNMGVVFSEEYMNDIAHEIHRQHPQLDFVAVINMASRKVSLRTEREDINVGQITKYFGGGGRQQTAGFEIKDKLYYGILNSIFEN